VITKPRRTHPAGLFTPNHPLSSDDAYTLTPNDGQHGGGPGCYLEPKSCV
jgi:hypothetical protein